MPKLRFNVTNKSRNVTNETALILCDVCCMCLLAGRCIRSILPFSSANGNFLHIELSPPELLWTCVKKYYPENGVQPNMNYFHFMSLEATFNVLLYFFLVFMRASVCVFSSGRGWCLVICITRIGIHT